MIARRRLARATGPSTRNPSASGRGGRSGRTWPARWPPPSAVVQAGGCRCRRCRTCPIAARAQVAAFGGTAWYSYLDNGSWSPGVAGLSGATWCSVSWRGGHGAPVRPPREGGRFAGQAGEVVGATCAAGRRAAGGGRGRRRLPHGRAGPQPLHREPRLCLEVNVDGSFNVFDAARQAGVQKVVFSSASSVYGDTLEVMDEGHPLQARTVYGAPRSPGRPPGAAWEHLRAALRHAALHERLRALHGLRAGALGAAADRRRAAPGDQRGRLAVLRLRLRGRRRRGHGAGDGGGRLGRDVQRRQRGRKTVRDVVFAPWSWPGRRCSRSSGRCRCRWCAGWGRARRRPPPRLAGGGALPGGPAPGGAGAVRSRRSRRTRWRDEGARRRGHRLRRRGPGAPPAGCGAPGGRRRARRGAPGALPGRRAPRPRPPP